MNARQRCANHHDLSTRFNLSIGITMAFKITKNMGLIRLPGPVTKGGAGGPWLPTGRAILIRAKSQGLTWRVSPGALPHPPSPHPLGLLHHLHLPFPSFPSVFI